MVRFARFTERIMPTGVTVTNSSPINSFFWYVPVLNTKGISAGSVMFLLRGACAGISLLLIPPDDKSYSTNWIFPKVTLKLEFNGASISL